MITDLPCLFFTLVLTFNLLSSVNIPASHDDASASLGQLLSSLLPNAASAAGHDDRLPVHPGLRLVSPAGVAGVEVQQVCYGEEAKDREKTEEE